MREGRVGGEPLRETLHSGGVPVTVEWFEGKGSGARPAVLMLHGADGLKDSGRYQSGAHAIAAEGYGVALLHYLDRTGERRASFAGIARNFMPWLDTVRDALAWMSHRPDVDPARIGLVGISLGGSLGLAAASRDRRIKALVDYFGPLPAGAMGTVDLPPTLILHGARDPIVPVANAYAVEAVLKQQGGAYEIKVYPDQGHGFHGTAFVDANRRVAAFLGRYLTTEEAARRAALAGGPLHR